MVITVRQPAPDTIAFEVSDTGIGMSEAEIKVALEPFGQVDAGTSRRHEGTGLGLPLAARLTELHGGTFRIASRKGHGTTVTLTLSAAARSPELSIAAPVAVLRPQVNAA